MSDTLWFRTIFPKLYETAGPDLFGGKAFVASMQSVLAKDEVLQEILHMQRRPVAKPSAEYRSEYAHAHTGMALAYLSRDRSMKAIAEVFECIMPVSRAVKAYKRNHGKRFGLQTY